MMIFIFRSPRGCDSLLSVAMLGLAAVCNSHVCFSGGMAVLRAALRIAGDHYPELWLDSTKLEALEA